MPDEKPIEEVLDEVEARLKQWSNVADFDPEIVRRLVRELRQRVEREQKLINAIPTNWCDPLLSGDNAALSVWPPYSTPDVERLLRGLKNRLKTIIEQPAPVTEEAEEMK